MEPLLKPAKMVSDHTFPDITAFQKSQSQQASIGPKMARKRMSNILNTPFQSYNSFSTLPNTYCIQGTVLAVVHDFKRG